MPAQDFHLSDGRVAERLLAWYGRAGRDLPWRRTRDPYRIWLSEIMLQQTGVDAVVPYYERFLVVFPSIADLAAAPVERVLERWAGLGYYRRARHLHATARLVMERHGGRLPDDLKQLMALPGIGRSTAGRSCPSPLTARPPSWTATCGACCAGCWPWPAIPAPARWKNSSGRRPRP